MIKSVFVIALCFIAFNGMAQSHYKNSLGMEFVKIKAGSFKMGSPDTETGHNMDENQHTVILTSDFFLQTTEVTRGQWKNMMQGDPSPFKRCGDNCPVSRLKYEWIEVFINKLNTLNTQYTYRLPTEAEWEYAARAGSNAAFSSGECLSQTHANFKALEPYDNCNVGGRSKGPSPVASYQANAWGLYDMHGNVWEMCSDYYAPYKDKASIDPKGPLKGKHRVLRGSSWFSGQSRARSASRFYAVRDIAGFRLVMTPKTPKLTKNKFR